MFYKHWKKIALTLTAMFWASCDNTSNEAPLYGVPACDTDKCDIEEPVSSSDVAEPESSSSENPSSSAGDVSCHLGDSTISYYPPSYSADVRKRAAKEEAEDEILDKIKNILDPLDSVARSKKPQCLFDIQNSLMNFVALYGAPVHIRTEEICDDGSKHPTKEYLEFQAKMEEWEKNKPALDSECQQIYQERSKELEKELNECLSPSSEVTCTPLDSSVAYFPEDYGADVKKMWKEEAAKHDAVNKIDSIKQTLAETPTCLENLRDELDRFVALYGAPVVIDSAVESCSDGTIRPREEYAKFLKMKEEWEANLPALEEELKKVYENKLKELEARINKCLSGEAGE